MVVSEAVTVFSCSIGGGGDGGLVEAGVPRADEFLSGLEGGAGTRTVTL